MFAIKLTQFAAEFERGHAHAPPSILEEFSNTLTEMAAECREVAAITNEALDNASEATRRKK